NITGVTNAAISGDAQWVITLNASSISTYTRKTSVWVAVQTLPLPSQTSFRNSELLVNTDASRFGIVLYGNTDTTVYLYSRSSDTNVLSLFWTLTSSNIELSQDLSTAFQLDSALKGVNVTKLDWTKKQLVPSGFVPVALDSYTSVVISDVSADGSSFIVDDEVLARNSSRGWITNDLHIAFGEVVYHAFSGDNVFLFQSTPGGLTRYLLTDTTSAYLPYDVMTTQAAVYVVSNVNGSRIVFNGHQNPSKAYVLDIDGPRYPVRGVCQDDTWCQANLKCASTHYCYLPGSKSKPDNYSINITRHEVVIAFASANAMDCFAAGSSPIYQAIDYDNMIVANNTNVTIAIFDDKGNVSLIQVGLVSAASKTVIIDLLNNQTQVQVWLTSVCLNPAATSDVQVLSFSLPVDTTTSADTTKSTTVRSSTYSSASTLGMGSAVIMALRRSSVVVVVSVFHITPEASYLCSVVVDDRRLSDGRRSHVWHGPRPQRTSRGKESLLELKLLTRESDWKNANIVSTMTQFGPGPTYYMHNREVQIDHAVIAFKVTNSLGIPETSSTINSSSNPIDRQVTSSLLPSTTTHNAAVEAAAMTNDSDKREEQHIMNKTKNTNEVTTGSETGNSTMKRVPTRDDKSKTPSASSEQKETSVHLIHRSSKPCHLFIGDKSEGRCSHPSASTVCVWVDVSSEETNDADGSATTDYQRRGILLCHTLPLVASFTLNI
ncbi:flocculin-like protein, partial [Planoprotostelium fungivorum]